MSRLTGPLAALLLSLAAPGCSTEYECADACRKVYDECGTAVEVEGAALDLAQCEVVCEEGMARPETGAGLWLDCVEDSVCRGEGADEDDRDLARYDVEWCTPQFEILVVAG